VLIVLHERSAGGAGLAVTRCADRYAAYGWEPAFWVPGDGGMAEIARRITDRTWVRGRPIAYSLRGLRQRPGVVARLRATPAYLGDLRATLDGLRPAVVHANTYYCLPEATIARRAGVPVVLHAHEILGDRSKDRAILRWAASTADHVVAVSKAAAAPLGRLGIADRVTVVPNGVPLASSPSVPTDPPIVGTVGAISRRKGTDVFLDMAASIAARRPEVRFVVLGSDGPGADADFAAAVRRRAGRMSAHLDLEIRHSDDVAGELATWTVFVLPARQDPFPLAVLEAMSAGLPVVATAVGGIPEQIEQGVSGVLVPSDDPDALAAEVSRLLDDREARVRIGAAAAARATSVFSLQKQAAGLASVYAVVAAQGSGVTR
jgi:glycosyltransferase involved in cell wall biosynthesis